MKFLKTFIIAIIVINNVYAQDSLNCRLVTKISGANAYGFFIKDNYLYTVSDKFSIMDISDIRNPKLLYSYELSWQMSSVFVEDQYAYIAAYDGLIILNITSKTSPQIESYYKTGERESIEAVKVKDNIAYLGTSNYSFLVFDVSDPKNPHEIARVDKDMIDIDDVWELQIVGNLLFAAAEDAGVKIFDISDPSKPMEKATINTMPTSVVTLSVKDSILFFTAGGNLWSFNVADLSNPVMMDQLEGVSGSSIYIEGVYAYSTGYKSGSGKLWITDISDPYDLKIAGYYPMESVGSDVYVYNRLAYTAGQNEGVLLIYFNPITDVKEDEFQLNSMQLSQNYPNPFNPVTNISYQISSLSKVTLKVYDLLGREITTLVNEVKSPGNYNITYNAEDLTSGIYYYTLLAGNFSQTKKLVLLK